ncbi:MAG: DNA translocase FtsK [Chloroflexota bacterium]
MAKERSNKSREKSPARWGLFRMSRRRWVGYALLLVAVVALLFWQGNNIIVWFTSMGNNVAALFGWGLILLVLAIAAVVLRVWRWPWPVIIRRGRYMLGSIAFFFAIWGILALFRLGGNFGLGILGNPEGLGGFILAILRVLGLIILGVILFVPRPSWHVARRLFTWLAGLAKRQGVKKPARRPKAPMPLPVPPTPEEPVAASTTSTVTTTPATAQSRPSSHEELKQVAQEVWKKYGESSSLMVVDGWKLPPIDILEKSPEIQFSQADNVQRARLIEEALASYGVEAKVVQINAGPTVTQFGVEPGWDRKTRDIREKDRDGNVKIRQEEVSKTRIKVDRITSLANDLALALAASSIRIEAPVPGKSMVGVEVPNTISSVVSLRGVIETSSFQKIEARSKLSLALGKGAGGEAIAADLAKMPHLLIAGATGSGKTVCLNATICCLLLYNTPYDVRFIMIDPKRVELTSFNSIPHLAAPVVVDADKAIDSLRWLSQEMDRRYQKMAAAGARNIEAYNKNRTGADKMAYLVLVIDELADLMMLGGDEVERILCRLAQLSRAVGIHLVVATQRPSVDVVTGLIKANFPTRISFAVTSQVDSRTILDGVGAEKLLGKGDMLYMPTEADKPKRLQGCFVSDPEIERLVYFWNNQRQEDTSLRLDELKIPPTGHRTGIPEDPLLAEARLLAKEHTQISTSFLQRRLGIGYPRAARLKELLEEEETKGKEETS